jgi:hypothetical protein
MSVNGKSAGGKGYRVVENVDATVAKAVTFVLKRASLVDDIESGAEGEDYLICNAEGWVSVVDLVRRLRFVLPPSDGERL